MIPDRMPRPTRLSVDGTFNFRQVSPGLLREGRLYRSDALHRLTAAGRRQLAGMRISRVIDLRSRLDRRLTGRDRLRGVGAEYLSIPIRGVGGRIDPATITLAAVYRTILLQEGAQVGAAIRAIADADGPVVVHCTAGKDRTGIVIALILLALGVDADTVTADFESSASNLAGAWTDQMVRKARRFGVSFTDQLFEVLAGSPASALRDALRIVEEERGGLRAYLIEIGVDDVVVRRLHASLDRR
ncbi:tyrosine-protein phosphatase [Microbacterium sp. zg.B48]|uniref:tyrosine-protein phosphatase n=1 Tax=Microbacterium sp. zg.B48 TaxID=2969408 RepID=UPI00214AF9AC|nr:tyrosine-protein phosphatase [Microbacterium sp. zg.B48]MCR2764288.1 tyrosine-protein phosphatase [Microbacterium sp. zg.B48]